MYLGIIQKIYEGEVMPHMSCFQYIKIYCVVLSVQIRQEESCKKRSWSCCDFRH